MVNSPISILEFRTDDSGESGAFDAGRLQVKHIACKLNV